eukprot:scaffold104509_cov33-Phaeocystis_antarctica.AAC.1
MAARYASAPSPVLTSVSTGASTGAAPAAAASAALPTAVAPSVRQPGAQLGLPAPCVPRSICSWPPPKWLSSDTLCS